MTDDDLRQLREVFRQEFKRRDFCLREEQVERVFTQLLQEEAVEPPDPPQSRHAGSLDEISSAQKKAMCGIGGEDSTLYKVMKGL